MKANSTSTAGPVARLLASALAGLLVAGPAVASLTDIANIPLVNATSKVVLPNIWFVLDDSGSMAWRTIPGATGETQFIPRLTDFWSSSHCNGLAYNPSVTYSKPPSLGSTTYNDSNFTAACSDGFAASGCSNNLTNSIYFTYSGAEADLGFAYNAAGTAVVANNFYNQCNTASATITVGGGTRSCQVTSVKVGTVELLPVATLASTNQTTVASRIAANVTTAGYAAMVDPGNSKRVLIYSNSASDATKNPSVLYACSGGGSDMTFTRTAFPTAAAGPGLGKFTAVKLTASATAAEKTNYANWYSYYRNRVSMAKSSIAAAFQDVRGTPKSFGVDPADGDFFHARVGFSSLHDNSGLGDLTIAAFDSTQKSNFFNRLYGADASGGTPLRTALKEAGEMYKDVNGPIQYYCQRNNTLLTTDGYWNDGTAPSGINNQDGGTTQRPQYEGPTASSASLADVAMYYYKTDLRTGGDFDKLLPEPSATANTLIDDVIRTQHMTTFTVGMGVDGTLKYDPVYKISTDTTTDFYKILHGTANWPVPAADTPKAVDDLWHAAVNGRGTYFSAKNPRALAANLKTALNQMNVDAGSGGANATGALNPTPGVDRAYSASYLTSDWTGDVSAYPIDSNGDVLTTKAWSAAQQLKAKITVDGKGDTRTIYTGTTTLVPFKAPSLGAGDLAYFDNSQLNQYIDEWTAAQKTAGTATTLINYLRGQSEYEVKSGATAQLYRARKEILGDIIHSQPVYVGKPSFYFQDAGYAAFKGASRAAAVYVGANDGMLHGFDAATGNENWAYVPPAAYPGLWRLADRDYSINHRYFVDGTAAVSDAYFGGAWHTVLIGGLGAGGRGYFALDITDPTTPSLLWTYSADNNPNVGYTFGTPLMAKLADGTWAAILASGYNNVPEGPKYATATGRGYVFVLNLATGAVIKTIDTGVGSVATPSGLATLNVEVKSSVDYTVKRAYGGDLYGNMWRVDLAAGTASKLMELGSSQPITSAPEIARPNGSGSSPMVLFGTGRYLGRSDLENSDQQAFYAVKDDGSTKVSVSDLTQQILSASGVLNASSTVSQWGWYFNLPNSGERVNIHPQIQLGVLLFVTTVPPPASLIPANQDAACLQDAGTGWLYQVNYKNGNSVDGDNQVGIKLNSPPVGMVLIGTKNVPSYGGDSKADGKYHIKTGKDETVTGDIKKPLGSGVPGSATRLQWRELLK